MLNSIRLQNFRKHADLTVRFTAGINAIRAPNESGKSTTLEGIAYAFFGAKGLKDGETIADVVTYDMPVNKLSVELVFTLAHVEYTLVRSPKGAELSFGREKVTGQTEVTRFVEGLLGASQDMASKLMLAKQKNLGAALSGGATAAGKMIEDLAGLDLIDELIALIGEKLPAGNTSVQEASLSTLRGQAAPAELADLAPLQDAHAAATKAVQDATIAHQRRKSVLDDLDVDLAREILVQERLMTGAIDTHQKAAAAAQATIDLADLPAVAYGAIEALQARIAAQKDLEAAAKLHAQLKSLDTGVLWDRPYAELEAEVALVQAQVKARQEILTSGQAALRALETMRKQAKSDYELERTRLEGRLIKETTCALCQKDLADVPEVAAINSPISKQLLEITAAHQEAMLKFSVDEVDLISANVEDETLLSQAKSYLKDLEAVVTANRKFVVAYAGAAQYIVLDESVVPAQWTWTGPTDAPESLAGELAALQKQHRAWQAQDLARAAARQHLADAQTKLADAQAALAELQIRDARETLELEVEVKARVQQLLGEVSAAERRQAAAAQELELARQAQAAQAERQVAAVAALAAAEAVLTEMQANNALIKKLRTARPVITDRLWAIVLSSVSNYAADVRGEKSIVTRADGKFKVNGRPVTGYSGSAEDALGLSIRFSLTKTFLANVDFVILDEVAAACDDQRELAMLGLLATSGFAQTILVTHSSHCDAFSDNMIVL